MGYIHRLCAEGHCVCVSVCVWVRVHLWAVRCGPKPLVPSYTVSHLFLIKATVSTKQVLGYFPSSFTGLRIEQSDDGENTGILESQGWQAP